MDVLFNQAHDVIHTALSCLKEWTSEGDRVSPKGERCAHMLHGSNPTRGDHHSVFA
jgi:hypothetical protein